jgi:L-lactate dehydrogenase complex protein LldE
VDAPDRRRAPAALAQGRGIDLVELPHAEECCGFDGTFAVKNADTSIAMLSDKVRCVLDTGAEYCAATDNSCLKHIGGALHRQRTGVNPIHIAEILASTEDGVRFNQPAARTGDRRPHP